MQIPLLPYTTAYEWTAGRRQPPPWLQPIILSIVNASRSRKKSARPLTMAIDTPSPACNPENAAG